MLLAVATLLAAGAGSPAQAQFGRNKVQYRSFDFRIIRTEHFDLHYYPDEREAALDAARMAERAYRRLSRTLGHEFDARKPIILYASHAHFQQTNALAGLIDEGTGGVTEILKNRVILPFTGSYADFDHVLTHELVHAFQFDVIVRSGIMTERGPATMGRLPLWFMEGMAEYLAIGRIDPHTASWVRDAVLKGYIRSVAEMNRQDDYLSYRFGQSLWAYIAGRWGDDVIGTLLDKAPRVGLERAFLSTLGVTLEELSADWLRSIRSTYLPELARHGSPGEFASRLTGHESFGDPWYLAPALSPDGRWLVFASQRDGFFMDLWLADGRTGEVVEKLVEGSQSAGFESIRYQSSTAAFSPDGRHLAFAAQSGGRDVLYIYDVPRRRVVRTLEPDLEGIGNPSWAPDGTRLVFTGVDGGISDLFVMDLEGRLTRLTDDRFADLQPSWSPDGRTIAFSTDRGPGTDMDRLRYGNMRVALLRVATREIEVLPHQDDGKNINPVWSPDGRELAWVGDRTGTNNLYLYDREGRELRRVTDVLSGIIGTNHLTPVLTWSRGSGRLVFVYFEGAGYNLYGVDDPRRLPVLERWRDSAPLVARTTPASSRAESGAPEPPTEPGDSAASGGAPAPPARTSGRAAGGPSPDIRPDSLMGVQFGGWRLDEARAFGAPSDRAARVDGIGGADRPVSVMELLDSADAALPDTSTFQLLDYRVRLTHDVIGRPSIGVQAGGYTGTGVYGGSYITLSDLLGNHHLAAAANLNGSLSDAVFYGGYGFFRHRANLTVSAQQVPYYRYRGYQQLAVEVDGKDREALANVYLRDVVRSVDASVQYPLSAFRRVELGARAAYFQRDNLFRGFFTESGKYLDREERVGSMRFYEPSVALVFDNALFGWTGPIHGRRYRLQLSHTAGDIEFTEAFVDARNYWNRGGRIVLATRVVGLVRAGADGDRFSLFWGGPYFLRGYGARSFDPNGRECREGREDGGSLSRCPPRDQLIGSSAAFVNAEVRIPVITELRLGPLGAFPPVDAVAFFDGGLAWDDRVCDSTAYDPTRDCGGSRRDVHVVWKRDPGADPYLWRAPLFSYGVGLRFNVFYAVVRLDYAIPLSRDRGGVFSVAFGPSF